MRSFSQTINTTLSLCAVMLAGLLISSCGDGGLDFSQVDAHYLQYEVKYEEEMAGDIPTRWLPRTMECWYTDHYAMTSITAFMNQFSLVQVANLRNGRTTTMVNFFGARKWYESDRGELPAAVVDPGIISIGSGSDTMSIGGLLSYRSMVVTEEGDYSIYFTRDFETRNPNLSTPYRELEHPMSDFRIQVGPLKMQLRCKSYEEVRIERDEFRVPENYGWVNRETMEMLIGNLFIQEEIE